MSFDGCPVCSATSHFRQVNAGDEDEGVISFPSAHDWRSHQTSPPACFRHFRPRLEGPRFRRAPWSAKGRFRKAFRMDQGPSQRSWPTTPTLLGEFQFSESPRPLGEPVSRRNVILKILFKKSTPRYVSSHTWKKSSICSASWRSVP